MFSKKIISSFLFIPITSLLLLSFDSVQAHDQSSGHWGGICFNDSSNTFSYSWKYHSEEEVLNQYNDSYCTDNTVWTGQGWFAIAGTYDGASGWSYGERTMKQANEKALKSCTRFSNEYRCTIRVVFNASENELYYENWGDFNKLRQHPLEGSSCHPLVDPNTPPGKYNSSGVCVW
jgi:hypothetical protein